MLGTMAKKRKPAEPPPEPPRKEVLYIEMDPTLKKRLVRLAELPHRRRKISAEGIIAIQKYVEEEEAKEGLGPIQEEGPGE